MRFFGIIGYADSVETPEGSGVWVDTIIEVQYYGDVVRDTKRENIDEDLNNDISVDNSISIVADDIAINNFLKIKYVTWLGERWTVSSVQVKPPRLILSIGSVYNGPTP